MAKVDKEQEFNPWQYYFMIGAGVCFTIVAFTRHADQWPISKILHLGVGIASIVYAVYKLVKK
jgi:hypothetical protein